MLYSLGLDSHCRCRRMKILLLLASCAGSPGCLWGDSYLLLSACLTPSGLSPTLSFCPNRDAHWLMDGPFHPLVQSLMDLLLQVLGSRASLGIFTVPNWESNQSASVTLYWLRWVAKTLKLSTNNWITASFNISSAFSILFSSSLKLSCANRHFSA